MDIFTGAITDTWSGVDKYGSLSKTIQNMSWMEKLEYALTERILPNGTVGQITKLLQSFKGGESSPGVENDPINEAMNMFFGVKIRTVNVGNEFAKRIKFGEFSDIESASEKLEPLITEKEKIQSQIDRNVKGVGQSELDAINERIEEEKLNAAVKANKSLEDARVLVKSYLDLGYTESEIKSLLKEQKATKYMINFLFNDKLIEYDDEGQIIANRGGSGSSRKNRSFEEDFGDDLDDDLGEDFSEDLGD